MTFNKVPKKYKKAKIYVQLVYNKDPNNLYYDQIPRLGAFEVSLNGVLLYSKLVSKMWPNVAAVANRCANICKDFDRGVPIENHKTTGIYKRIRAKSGHF